MPYNERFLRDASVNGMVDSTAPKAVVTGVGASKFHLVLSRLNRPNRFFPHHPFCFTPFRILIALLIRM